MTARRPAGRRARPPRRPTGAGPLAGREIELEVGPVAHGGHCVARFDGRVIFVRHALPGERVLARITEDTGGSYARADAVRVCRAGSDRVRPACPHAGPGRCGGCDFQHVRPAAQRDLKAAVVREQLARLAGLTDVPVAVEELPGGPLGWRTRVQFAVDGEGRVGLRRHRSRQVEPVGHCPLATPGADALDATRRTWPGASVLSVTAATGAGQSVVVTPRDPRRRPSRQGDATLAELAAGREWRVSTGVFWQVHPLAASTLAACVLDLLGPAAGDVALDLYCGAGLFAGVLAEAVGVTGRVLAVESDAAAVADARVNLSDYPWASVRRASVTPELLTGLSGSDPDLVVLDPPRSGAGKAVVAQVCRRRPRAVGYVACDPAALARDLAEAARHGYRLAGLRAFDLFPMTHHVECVALLRPVD
ncbi:MAG TPA: TRAM domain-containing protein [Mycobacteriales bacterium]|nr:TRAM domain-containing protein [Mycobacteriales bacterium]